MQLALALKLTVTSSAVTGFLSTMGLVGYVRAYQQAAALDPAIAIEWSGFVVPLLLVVAFFALSALGFFGILLASPQRTRTFAFAYAAGAILVLLARWALVAIGFFNTPQALGAALGMLALAWFSVLAFALRPNYAFNRTAVTHRG